jgi:hypothetical protein
MTLPIALVILTAAILRAMNLAAAIRMIATLTVVITIGVMVTTRMALTRITLEKAAALAGVRMAVAPVTLAEVKIEAREAATVVTGVVAKVTAKVVEKATTKVVEKGAAKTNSPKLLLLCR